MAEFCWECWNKVNDTHAPKFEFRLSWGKELCEECGQMKRVVISPRAYSLEAWLSLWSNK